MNDDMPWVNLTQEEVEELRSKKQELTQYGKKKIRELMSNPLKLNEKAAAFSYTPAELFNTIMNIVAHPHKTLTDHDKTRAMAIFVTFADYLNNYTESDNNGGHYVYESDATDFEGYVLELLGQAGLPGFDRVDVNEVLK